VLLSFATACGVAGSKHDVGAPPGSFSGFDPNHAALVNPGGSQDFRFGSALAWLDWNQDGRLDLVVGSPGQSSGGLSGVGAAFLYTQDVNQTFALARAFVPTNWDGVASLGSMNFAEAIAVGDFDGDGREDIAFGAPGDTASAQAVAGRVYVAFNDAAHNGVLKGPFEEPSGAEAGAEYGATLAAGTLDSDAVTDLVVGAPEATVSGHLGAGRLTGLLGGGTPATWPVSATAAIVSAVPADDAFFATSIAVGDVNKDGKPDIVVGEPGATLGSGGAVRILSGDGAATPAFATFQTLLTNEAGVQVELGTSVALGDFDQDGDLDVAAGAPYGDVDATTEAGYVVVFQNLNPVAGHFLAGAPLADVTQEGGAQFGATLIVTDMNGDGVADLISCAPAATANATPGAGSATVLASLGNGAFATPDADNVVEAASPGDDAGFGFAVMPGDVDGDGAADVVAVGAPGPVDPLFLQPGTVEVVRPL
jgi:hypothetical protein